MANTYYNKNHITQNSLSEDFRLDHLKFERCYKDFFNKMLMRSSMCNTNLKGC